MQFFSEGRFRIRFFLKGRIQIRFFLKGRIRIQFFSRRSDPYPIFFQRSEPFFCSTVGSRSTVRAGSSFPQRSDPYSIFSQRSNPYPIFSQRLDPVIYVPPGSAPLPSFYSLRAKQTNKRPENRIRPHSP